MRVSSFGNILTVGVTLGVRCVFADDLSKEVFDAIDSQDEGLRTINTEARKTHHNCSLKSANNSVDMGKP